MCGWLAICHRCGRIPPKQYNTRELLLCHSICCLQARAAAPAIIFIDEIDSVGRIR